MPQIQGEGLPSSRAVQALRLSLEIGLFKPKMRDLPTRIVLRCDAPDQRARTVLLRAKKYIAMKLSSVPFTTSTVAAPIFVAT
jgi:hypothetical protein